MDLLGMATRNLYKRYDIGKERKIKSVEKIAGVVMQKPTRKVLGLRAGDGEGGRWGRGRRAPKSRTE